MAPEGYGGLGALAFQDKRFGEAFEYFRQLSVNAPGKRAAGMLRQAETLEAMGEVQKEIDLADLVLQQSPNLDEKLEAYYRRGVAYQAMKEPDLAVAAFTKVVELDPEGSIGWFAGVSLIGMGQIAVSREQLPTALTAFEKAARLFQPNYPVYSAQALEKAIQVRRLLGLPEGR
jgi:tetratricopeptide (TPR) repeat protein